MRNVRFGHGVLLWIVFCPALGMTQKMPEKVVVEARAAGRPFPHFWEEMFGSGRAILSLRDSYRSDLRDVKKVTDFGYVRFHNILHDELGVYDEDEHGSAIYNFSYIDQIYDGLLKNGVRPFVEISFMPTKLAAHHDEHPFWYKPIVAPPKDFKKWDDLIRALAQHLVDRYGLDEVSKWYFEVWNEPNIDFWTGEPKQTTYFELYDHTALSLKAVSPRLRVGGPATSSAHWVADFIEHATAKNIPTDFISSHGYGDDSTEDLFGTRESIPMDHRVCLAIKKVHDQIRASARPDLPLMWTEWNVPSFGPARARDTEYVGAALADDIRQCDGLVDMLSFWTFSDVFEEDGPKREPFDGSFGLIGLGGIKKPSFSAFALLHKLGVEILPNSANVLVTRRNNGSLAIAAWNLVDPGTNGSERWIKFEIRGVRSNSEVHVSRADGTHGNTLASYRMMGSPQYPTPAQVREMNRVADDMPVQDLRLDDGSILLSIPVNGVVLIEVIE